MSNPRPPILVGRDTNGQEVDSSAIIRTPGKSAWTWSFSRRKKAIASRFSRPPYSLGTHSPGPRE